MTNTPFRRAFIHRPTSRVGVELNNGFTYTLPNPTPEGKTYNPDLVLLRLTQQKSIDLSRWESMPDEHGFLPEQYLIRVKVPYRSDDV